MKSVISDPEFQAKRNLLQFYGYKISKDWDSFAKEWSVNDQHYRQEIPFQEVAMMSNLKFALDYIEQKVLKEFESLGVFKEAIK